MVRLEAIEAAHQKVRSGADFPSFAKALRELGIVYYDYFVADGHTVYEGSDEVSLISTVKNAKQLVEKKSNLAQFQADLKSHQEGKTDFSRFCADAAKSGVVKWRVNLEDMTCSYFDVVGHLLLQEEIP